MLKPLPLSLIHCALLYCRRHQQHDAGAGELLKDLKSPPHVIERDKGRAHSGQPPQTVMSSVSRNLYQTPQYTLVWWDKTLWGLWHIGESMQSPLEGGCRRHAENCSCSCMSAVCWGHRGFWVTWSITFILLVREQCCHVCSLLGLFLTQVLLIALTMASLFRCPSKPRQWSSTHNIRTRTEAGKWNPAIICFIIFTPLLFLLCPVKMCTEVCLGD